MGATSRVLFEKCPLCHAGTVEITSRAAFTSTVPRINPCPICGAIFSPSEGGRFKLGYCDPRKLASARGKTYPASACADCLPFVECWLGKSLSKSDWDRIGSGGTPEAWMAYEEESEALQAGDLPVLPADSESVYLGEGEVVHHISLIYLSEVTIPGNPHDEAQLFLTSRRIIIVHESAAFNIRLADVEKVEQSFPGFVIQAKGVGQPLYCFPVSGDPVYHAIVGALRKIH